MAKNCYLLSACAGAAAMVLACSASAQVGCLLRVDPDFVNNDDCAEAGRIPGYIDPNGGCNFDPPNLQGLGPVGVPSTTNITGTVGTFIPFGGTDFTTRDLDWYTFSIADCAEVNVTLRMNNRDDEGGAIGFDSTIIFVAPGGCPLTAAFYAAEGPSCSHSTGPIILSAGTYMVVVTTPFETAGSDPYPIYNCPASYELVLGVAPLSIGAGACGSNGTCADTYATGGCEDCACCSLVCGVDPDCCDSAWDADCVNSAVELCGIFIYDCPPAPGAPANNCATAATMVDFGDSVCVSTINATTDGPNGLASLCAFGIGNDVWYMVHTPAAGELVVDGCALSFDSGLAVYDIGLSPAFNPEDFTQFPGACVDDTCGVVAGGSAITLVNVEADHYYLVRIGSFFDDKTPPVSGTGVVSFDFNSEVFNSGGQRSVNVLATGAVTNLGLSSGFQIGTFTQRWCAVPFTLGDPDADTGGPMPWSIQGIIGKGFVPAGVTNDRLCWAIWARSGQSVPVTMIAEGCCCELEDSTWVMPFNYDDPRDAFATAAWRIEMDPMELAPGNYYMTIYGSNGNPDDMAPSNWAWFIYAIDGIPMTNVSLPSVGGRFGYRSQTPAGGFLVYTGLEGVYEVTGSDDPITLYTNSFFVVAQPSCNIGADRNGDGCVNGDDLAIITGQWDPLRLLGNGYGPGDANCDGVVDGEDLAIVLGGWSPLACCPS